MVAPFLLYAIGMQRYCILCRIQKKKESFFQYFEKCRKFVPKYVEIIPFIHSVTSIVISSVVEKSLNKGTALKVCPFLSAQKKRTKRKHHPTKAFPQGKDATAPPVALSLRYAQTIKGLA